MRAVPADSLCIVRFTVWVSENGRIDYWRLDGQSPPGPWATAVLFDLQATAMRAATLNGEAVPSELHIEMGLDTRLR